MVVVDEEVDEEMMAEDAMGAGPCNTPRPGEGAVKRRVTVGPGMRPRRLLGETPGRTGAVDGRSVSLTEGVFSRDWAVQAATCG